MNKQELISTLKDLKGLDANQKAYLIDLVNTKKKYGLVWEDKPEDVEELLRQHLPVLSEVVERRIHATAKATEVPVPPPKRQEVQASLSFAETANPTNDLRSSTL